MKNDAPNLNLAKKNANYVEHELKDIVQQIINDQCDWIDGLMKQILTTDEYKLCMDESKGDTNKRRIFDKYRLKLEIIPDVCGLRLWMGEKNMGDFRSRFTYDDGQKIWNVDPHPAEVEKGDDSAIPGRSGWFGLGN